MQEFLCCKSKPRFSTNSCQEEFERETSARTLPFIIISSSLLINIHQHHCLFLPFCCLLQPSLLLCLIRLNSLWNKPESTLEFLSHTPQELQLHHAFAAGLPLDMILGWAHWTSADSFAKHYHKQLLSADAATF